MQSIILILQHFINREHELEFLNRKYAGNSPRMVVLYGRRRVGGPNLSNIATGHPTAAELRGIIIKMNYACRYKINIHGMYTTRHVCSVGAGLVDSCEFGTADERGYAA